MRSKQHIAIVCPACGGTGSVAGVALHHAIELSKYFWVTLVSDSFLSIGLPGVNLLKVTPRRFSYLRRFCHVPNEYFFAKSVRDSLDMTHKDNPIDMVICHGHALATLSSQPLKEKYGIPYAMVTHGDIFDRPKGTYDCRLTAFYKAVTPYAYRNADLIFAISPYMASCAIRGGASPESVKVVPNGIDPADIGMVGKKVPPGIADKGPDDPLNLLFVGRLSVDKGVDVLINACHILNQRCVNFILNIIGEGPLENRLRTLVKQSGLSERVTFIGKVQRRSLYDYYRSSDLLCVTSLSESFGLVILEALISGIPVIASNVGGIPSIITDGVNGVLFPPANTNALSETVEHLYRNRDELIQLKTNAIPSVSTKYSWETIGKSITTSINEVLAQSVYPKTGHNT